MKTGRFLVLSIAFCEAEDAVPRLVSASPFCSLLLSLSLYKLMVELIDKFVFNNSHQLLHSPSQICMWFVCLCVCVFLRDLTGVGKWKWKLVVYGTPTHVSLV